MPAPVGQLQNWLILLLSYGIVNQIKLLSYGIVVHQSWLKKFFCVPAPFQINVPSLKHKDCEDCRLWLYLFCRTKKWAGSPKTTNEKWEMWWIKKVPQIITTCLSGGLVRVNLCKLSSHVQRDILFLVTTMMTCDPKRVVIDMSDDYWPTPL